VRNKSGALVSTHNEASPDNRTEVFDGSEREAEALVERIIAGNDAPIESSAVHAPAVAVQP